MLLNKKTIAFALLPSVLLFGAIASSAPIKKQPSQATVRMDNDAEFKRDEAKILAARDSESLTIFQRTAGVFEEKWHDKPQQYANLMTFLVKTLGSSSFADSNKQTSLARSYARKGLAVPIKIPVQQQVDFLMWLGVDVTDLTQVKTEHWPAKRRDSAKLWLQAWQQLESEIDSNFDENKAPLDTDPTPPGLERRRGTWAVIMKDPKVRAQYTANVERNHHEWEAFNKQIKLQRLRVRFQEDVKYYIVKAYSQQPYQADELKRNLDFYVKDQKLKDEILAAVEKNIQVATVASQTVPQNED